MENIKEIVKKHNLYPLVPLVGFNKHPIVKWSKEDFRIYSSEDLMHYKLKSYMNWISKQDEVKKARITGYAFLTGKVSNSVVIDLDNKNDKKGEDNFYKLAATIGIDKDLLNTFTVTTPTGGKHLYFKYYDGFKTWSNVLEGVDIRSNGGLVVSPFSMASNGNYEVLNDVNILDIPIELAVKLIELGNKGNENNIKENDDMDFKPVNKYGDDNWFNIIKQSDIAMKYLRAIGVAVDGTMNNCCCPIHKGDNKGAFHYNLEENKFYCNTKKCVDGGSIIDVYVAVEKIHNNREITSLEAVKELADMYNITLPKTNFKNRTELINHANYVPNKIYNIDKYINENKGGVNVALKRSNLFNDRVLFIAPTGSGKTYSFIKDIKEKGIKTLFVFPNVSNVEQAVKKYDIPGAYGDIDPKKLLKENNLIALTWNKVEKLSKEDLSKYIMIIDETHQLNNDLYRSKAIKNVIKIKAQCKGVIEITATPNKLNFKMYDYIIEYKQNIQTHYEVKLYDNINQESIYAIARDSKKFLMLLDNKSELMGYKALLSNYKNIDLIYSDIKEESKLYDSIVTNENIGDYEGLLNTSTIISGVNINDPDITDIIVVGFKDIGTIKQYVARARGLKKVRVHIFNSFKEYTKESKTYDIESLIKHNMNASLILAAHQNKMLELEKSLGETILYRGSKGDDVIYFDTESETYRVSEQALRCVTYKTYYSNRNINMLKDLLHEYFEDIEIVNTDKQDIEDIKISKPTKENVEYILNELKPHKHLLVGHTEITKGKNLNKILDYFYVKSIEFEELKIKYKYLGINSLVNEIPTKIPKILSLYTKYVITNDYPLNLAWELSILSDSERSNYYERVNILLYYKLLEKGYKVNMALIENQILEYLLDIFKVGNYYTDEHIQIIVDNLINKFGKFRMFNVKNIRNKLNNIFNIKCIGNVRNLDSIDCNRFHNNIIPEIEEGSRIRVYEIDDRINIYDLLPNLLEEDIKDLKNILQNKFINIEVKNFKILNF